MSRLLYNRAIIDKLQELVTTYPDWRFGQILFNSAAIFSDSEDIDGKSIIKDPFYEESETTWNRMLNNIYCFPE